MRRTIPSGRTRCAPSSVLTDTNQNQRGPIDRERDLRPSLIRLAQRYLEACRGNRPMTAVLERVWRRFYSQTDTLVRAAARACHAGRCPLDDCVQEAWQELVAFLPGYRHDPERGRFRDWVFVLVKRTLIRLERRERAWVFEPLPEGEGWPGREPDPATSLDRGEIRESVLHSLTMLRGRVSRMTYHVVVLRFGAEQSKSEVADRLALSLEQVRGHVDRARARLRACPGDPGSQVLD
jgi:RNA polymerase sigma factor (sigma-70 family)